MGVSGWPLRFSALPAGPSTFDRGGAIKLSRLPSSRDTSVLAVDQDVAEGWKWKWERGEEGGGSKDLQCLHESGGRRGADVKNLGSKRAPLRPKQSVIKALGHPKSRDSRVTLHVSVVLPRSSVPH